MRSESVRELLVDAANRAASYIEQLPLREVCAERRAVERLSAALDVPLPEEPGRPADILVFLDEYGSVAAQYLAAAWDQNCFSFVSSPAVACLEAGALRWLKDALGLPPAAEGALVTGATMANFTCLAAARNWTLERHGWDVERAGLFGAPPLTVVLGEEAHATIYKVLSTLGLGRERVLRVPADAQGRLRADLLPAVGGPAIVCVQAGNVNSGAFDPAEEVIGWARERHAWVHVDGAFGLWALASPQQAPLAQGFLGADSWAMDAHKWLNVPYHSGIAIVREREALVRAMSMSGAYLLPSGHPPAGAAAPPGGGGLPCASASVPGPPPRTMWSAPSAQFSRLTARCDRACLTPPDRGAADRAAGTLPRPRAARTARTIRRWQTASPVSAG